VITASDLKDLNSRRVLFKTDNSKLWESEKKEFQKNYVGLDKSAASWIAESNVKLVGIDYLSIARFNETKEVHQILLKNNIIILETLNLSNVEPGIYKLICLPLKISKAEAVPVRAVLIK
jgi:arylformamidase